MLINSAGWVPRLIQSAASDVSHALLVLSIAGVGLIKTSLPEFTQLGWRPVAIIILVTLGLAF